MFNFEGTLGLKLWKHAKYIENYMLPCFANISATKAWIFMMVKYYPESLSFKFQDD